MKPKEEAYTIDDLINKAKTYISKKDDLDLIKQAYLFANKVHAGQLRLTGDEYILHPLNVAYILTDIKIDVEGKELVNEENCGSHSEWKP